MSIDLRLPNITGKTQEERLSQLQSYTYQLVEKLNWALNALESNSGGGFSAVVYNGAQGNTASASASFRTFDSIKELIIKSSDIIQAYSDEIKVRFDGLYASKSDFGTFKQNTSSAISANSQKIDQYYTDLQTISGQVETILSTNAWIRSGFLEEIDGIPVYGIEVGQTTQSGGQEVFNKYARFTAEGIYFYLPSASKPIAWMSGRKLYVGNAEITESLKLGKYVCDTSDGVAFQWVGGV